MKKLLIILLLLLILLFSPIFPQQEDIVEEVSVTLVGGHICPGQGCKI